jgi:hypothetical protein
LAIGAAAVIPMAPFYDWKMLFDKGGEVMNDPQFGEFYNPEMGQMTQMMAVQQQQMEQQQGQADMQAQDAATGHQMAQTATEMQKPSLEREKIATTRAGIVQKGVSDKLKIAAGKNKKAGKK